MKPNLPPVSNYTIELAPNKDALIKKVNERLEAGWELQGPLSIKYPKNALFPMYGQALVWRKGLEAPAPSPSSSGCLGIFALLASIPPTAAIAAYLL